MLDAFIILAAIGFVLWLILFRRKSGCGCCSKDCPNKRRKCRITKK